jgi:hypothetical protein
MPAAQITIHAASVGQPKPRTHRLASRPAGSRAGRSRIPRRGRRWFPAARRRPASTRPRPARARMAAPYICPRVWAWISPSTPSRKPVLLASPWGECGALGGTRTPNLLIRSLVRTSGQCAGIRIRRSASCPVSGKNAAVPHRPVTLEVGGAGTYTQRAIPDLSPARTLAPPWPRATARTRRLKRHCTTAIDRVCSGSGQRVRPRRLPARLRPLCAAPYPPAGGSLPTVPVCGTMLG